MNLKNATATPSAGADVGGLDNDPRTTTAPDLYHPTVETPRCTTKKQRLSVQFSRIIKRGEAIDVALAEAMEEREMGQFQMIASPRDWEDGREARARESAFSSYTARWQRLQDYDAVGGITQTPLRYRDIPWPLFNSPTSCTDFPTERGPIFDFLLHPERVRGVPEGQILAEQCALWRWKAFEPRVYRRVVEAERDAVFVAWIRLWIILENSWEEGESLENGGGNTS